MSCAAFGPQIWLSRRLVALGAAVAVGLTWSASSLASDNQIWTQQSGSYNRLHIEQVGSHHAAHVSQVGSGQTAQVEQSSSGQRGVVLQGPVAMSRAEALARAGIASSELGPDTLEALGDIFASPDGGGGTEATLLQRGTGSRALTVQRGSGNRMTTIQQGAWHTAVHGQLGDNNDTTLNQIGNGLHGELVVIGDNNRYTLTQQGVGLAPVRITFRGNDLDASATVTQSGVTGTLP
jgi:hypothetical protein